MQKKSRHFSGVRSAKIDLSPRQEKQFCEPAPQPRKLLDHVRDVLRVNHYSVRTEEAYVGWIRRFILYHNKKHPQEMGALEVELYLTHLAVGEKSRLAHRSRHSTRWFFFITGCCKNRWANSAIFRDRKSRSVGRLCLARTRWSGFCAS